MSLLTALIVQNSHILVEIYFIFYLSEKTSYTKLEMLSISNLDLSEKIAKVVMN